MRRLCTFHFGTRIPLPCILSLPIHSTQQTRPWHPVAADDLLVVESTYSEICLVTVVSPWLCSQLQPPLCPQMIAERRHICHSQTRSPHWIHILLQLRQNTHPASHPIHWIHCLLQPIQQANQRQVSCYSLALAGSLQIAHRGESPS